MSLKIESVNVRTDDGIKIEVFAHPYGFHVLTEGGINTSHPDYEELNDDEFKLRITTIVRKM